MTRFQWLIAGLGVLLFAGALACSEDSKPVGAAISGDAVSATFGPAGGELASKDGRLLLFVPAGALSEPTTLTIAPAASAPPGALGRRTI